MIIKSNLLCFIILIAIYSGLCLSKAPEYDVIEGVIDRPYQGLIDFKKQKVIYYILDNNQIYPGITDIQISASIAKLSGKCPVLFSVRNLETVISWEMPIVKKSAKEPLPFYSTQRTICSSSILNSNRLLQVEISTCSDINIPFTLNVQLSNDFIVRLEGERKNVSITPTSPAYFRFFFDIHPDVNSALIRIHDSNENSNCMIFSIQQPKCPVNDDESNVQFTGYWQSVTSQASMIVKKEKYPDGFYLVFVALSDNKRCTEKSSIFEAGARIDRIENYSVSKNFSIWIEKVIEPSDYVAPTLLPLAFMLIIFFILLVTFSVFQNLLKRYIEKHFEKKSAIDSPISPSPNVDANFNLKFSKFQSAINLKDISEGSTYSLQRKSKNYFWSIVTIGVFYCIPVFQLITNYLKVLYRTGDYDLCYYNYRCARPFGYLFDFNHIYSNLGYIFFGFTFILFVKIKQKSFLDKKLSKKSLNEIDRVAVIESLVESESENMKKHPNSIFRKLFPKIPVSNLENGTIQNFGIYYALGIALILEGILSAAYHICPNESNFQFDTSFMYAIAVLGIVKIYQFRHPVLVSSNVTFISLAFVAASSVFGLLFNNLVFKICFSIFHFFGILSLLIYVYHIGFYMEDGVAVTSWIGVYKIVFRLTKKYKEKETESNIGRSLLPILGLTLNTVLIILNWTILRESNFATQLLAVFVANFSLYTFYYGIMKYIHEEYKTKNWIQLLTYSILSFFLWIVSLYFFQAALTSWDTSPADSRALNDECKVFNFYDNHDLWHFTSGAALLTSFMVLLTIDDDLILTRQSSIAVF